MTKTPLDRALQQLERALQEAFNVEEVLFAKAEEGALKPEEQRKLLGGIQDTKESLITSIATLAALNPVH